MRPDNSKWIILAVIAAIIGFFVGPMLMNGVSSGVGLVVILLIFIAVIAFIVWSLAANKVGKAASSSEQAAARTLTPGAGMARIYVVRRGFVGGMAGMKVDIAGVAAGQIRMNQFVMAEVPPGTYAVETAMARNGMKPSNSESRYTLGSGEAIVILAMLEMKAMHSMTVQQRLAPSEAKMEIGRSKLVQWTERPTVMA